MFARLCVSLLAVFLLVSYAPAQDQKVIDLRPKWKQSDLVRYEMMRTQTREADGKVTRKVVTNTPVEVAVVDISEEGAMLRWMQGSTVFEDPKLDDDPLPRAIYAMMKSLDIDFELDADGNYAGIRNWKEIRATGNKVRDTVINQMTKAGVAKTATDIIRKETDKILATKESIEAAFGKQPALLVYPFGQEYEVGKTVAYASEIPNVFGGEEPFPATGEYTLKSVDKDTNIAILVFKLKIDSNEKERIIRKWQDEVAKQAGKSAPEELPDIQIDDVIEYEFDLAAGWVKSVTHTRTAKEGKRTEIEIISLTRKPR